MARVTTMRKAILVMHAPTDDTVSIDNATRIFLSASIPRVLCRSREPTIC